MTQEPEFNTSHPEYVPFSNAYIGHVMTGGLVAVTVGLVYWLLSIPFSALKVNLQDFVIFIVLVVIGSELIVTLLQRPLVIKARHGSPGGALYAAYEVIVTPVVAGIGAFGFSEYCNRWNDVCSLSCRLPPSGIFDKALGARVISCRG